MSMLGIDLGNSGCRVVAFDDQLTEIAAAALNYRPGGTPADGLRLAEVRDVVFAGIRAVNGQCADDPVTGVSVSAMGETLVGVDADGRAVTELRMSHHRQGQSRFEAIVDRIGAERIRSITGQPVHAMFTLSHLA